MVFRSVLVASLLTSLASCVAPKAPTRDTANEAVATRPLKVASWNLEFLAEKDGAGCEPRTDADYAAMRQIVDTLDADVIAFQEAENEAAAARVFNPSRYTIVMEQRPGAASGSCGGKQPGQQFIRQAVGFAIRKGIAFDRNPDVTALQLGNPQLRSGVDIRVRAPGHQSVRLLAVHLKSGCFQGDRAQACGVLQQQVPVLEEWIDRAAVGPDRFIVLGDWNRRLAEPGDPVWTELDDGNPANADLRLADEGVKSLCDPRYRSFIDHIVLDRRAAGQASGFRETTYASGQKHLSDHCPVSVMVSG
ncbi:endonuclease/exonuclease/phosphatase family protein [uncultured Sphingomonas sp.]|uniref:endonuclease/exonuclease/phosphatase family protein n=1 Tax=uncultured Sphingomonas sp. TaxID=158754 RepID=UPI0025F61EDA|nr:endonuclease/exonuclease/phosphatase family protein [uncultured Sphingomonas sp.]